MSEVKEKPTDVTGRDGGTNSNNLKIITINYKASCK